MKKVELAPLKIRDGRRALELRDEGERIVAYVDAGLRFALPISLENARRVYEWLRELFGEGAR